MALRVKFNTRCIHINHKQVVGFEFRPPNPTTIPHTTKHITHACTRSTKNDNQIAIVIVKKKFHRMNTHQTKHLKLSTTRLLVFTNRQEFYSILNYSPRLVSKKPKGRKINQNLKPNFQFFRSTGQQNNKVS